MQINSFIASKQLGQSTQTFDLAEAPERTNLSFYSLILEKLSLTT